MGRWWKTSDRRRANKEKPRLSGVPITARNGGRSEAELGADVDRLAVLLAPFMGRHQPIVLLRVAQAGGDIEIAREPVALAEVDRLLAERLLRPRRGAELL